MLAPIALQHEVRAPPLAEVFDTSITGVRYMTRRRTPLDLLERFCRIADAPDTTRSVVAFARRWGLLGLCEHGLPNAGCPRHHREARSAEHEAREHPAWLWWSGRESFLHWKALALAFDSMLRIGLDLNRGRPGQSLDWQLAAIGLSGDLGEGVLGDWWVEGIILPDPDELTRRTPKGLRSARDDYQTLMQWLIGLSHLRPQFEPRGRNWNIELASPGSAGNLPAILTAQLLLRVGSSSKQTQCWECSRWFVPRRNQRKYCDRCGIHAAWRVAQRKRRG